MLNIFIISDWETWAKHWMEKLVNDTKCLINSNQERIVRIFRNFSSFGWMGNVVAKEIVLSQIKNVILEQKQWDTYPC